LPTPHRSEIGYMHDRHSTHRDRTYHAPACASLGTRYSLPGRTAAALPNSSAAMPASPAVCCDEYRDRARQPTSSRCHGDANRSFAGAGRTVADRLGGDAQRPQLGERCLGNKPHSSASPTSILTPRIRGMAAVRPSLLRSHRNRHDERAVSITWPSAKTSRSQAPNAQSAYVIFTSYPGGTQWQHAHSRPVRPATITCDASHSTP
jgi:hypothetical protein